MYSLIISFEIFIFGISAEYRSSYVYHNEHYVRVGTLNVNYTIINHKCTVAYTTSDFVTTFLQKISPNSYKEIVIQNQPILFTTYMKFHQLV